MVFIWLNAKVVVDGVMQSLFAAKIALGGLDRNMPEQELDLVQLAARKMA